MSAQHQVQAVTLVHRPHDSGYRLLELPPDLANLLESDAAPVAGRVVGFVPAGGRHHIDAS
ncbi:hypothetical protein UVI_02032000 [Ustilaginoidea virens]|uniref:Uncharacterized protein n=1 Tax=Ustilaginoidea virens TaxID=1159556 RepID=A0A1B5KU41_USTVR|nr:hypothetical protein UVI_02032000 [Ustilaginoidea virens]